MVTTMSDSESSTTWNFVLTEFSLDAPLLSFSCRHNNESQCPRDAEALPTSCLSGSLTSEWIVIHTLCLCQCDRSIIICGEALRSEQSSTLTRMITFPRLQGRCVERRSDKKSRSNPHYVIYLRRIHPLIPLRVAEDVLNGLLLLPFVHMHCPIHRTRRALPGTSDPRKLITIRRRKSFKRRGCSCGLSILVCF